MVMNNRKKGGGVVRGFFLGGKKDLIPVSKQEFWNYCFKIQKIKSSLKYNFVWDQHQAEIHRVLLKMSKKGKEIEKYNSKLESALETLNTIIGTGEN